MKLLIRGVSLLSALILIVLIAFPQSSPQREKVAEGQYSDWKDDHPLQDTAKSWTIWRTSDGFQLDAHLPTEKVALLVATMEKGLGSKMTPELRREMHDSVITTDIHLRLTKDRSITGLALDGVRVSDFKTIEVAQCHLVEAQIDCKGRAGKAHLKYTGQQLSCSWSFPLLFSPLFSQAKTQNQPTPFKLAILEGEDKKLALTEVSGQITSLGQEDILLGSHKFRAEKYLIAMETKTGPRKVTIWASSQGIVLAMEGSRLAPGLRTLLTQYKKYSDF